MMKAIKTMKTMKAFVMASEAIHQAKRFIAFTVFIESR